MLKEFIYVWYIIVLDIVEVWIPVGVENDAAIYDPALKEISLYFYFYLLRTCLIMKL